MTESKRATGNGQPRPASATVERNETAANVDPAAFGAGYGQAVLEAQKEWLIGVGRIQHDYLAFLGERLRKDIEIAGRMAECRDLEAALALQTAFIETAREDYLDGARRFWAMGQDLAQNCGERLSAGN